MPSEIPSGSNTFLTNEDRKPVEVSDLANAIKYKAPPNLAIYKDDVLHPVVEHIMKLAVSAKSAYQSQFSAMKEKWDMADRFYWMQQSEKDLPSLTFTQVNATSFFRCAVRLAEGAYMATWDTHDMPMKFFPDISPFDDSNKKQENAVVTEAMNRAAEFSMRRAEVRSKSEKAYHQVYKYGNLIIYTPWDYLVGEKERFQQIDPNEIIPSDDGIAPPSFVHQSTGEVRNAPHPNELQKVTDDVVTHNELGFYPQKIENCWLDNRIEDLDRQTMFFWRSDMTRPEIWEQAKSGNFTNVEMITELQKFQLYNQESQPMNLRITESGKTTVDSANTEVYERWQCWMLLPELKYTQNKKGEVTNLEWNQNGKSKRYLMELIGEVGKNSVCVRLCESPYPGTGIPFISAHSHEDDSGFWHRGLMELLKDNMMQEKSAKGQLNDNRELLTRRPLVRLVGRVRNKSMQIKQNTVFDVTSPDAIKQLEVNDISQTVANSLEMIKTESEGLANTPKFMLGEGIGGRTSASEFSSISNNGSAPALNSINKLNDQIFGGYLRKFKQYAPTFLDKSIMVPIAQNPGDPQPAERIYAVLPDELHADMVLKPTSVKEFENKTTTRQTFIQFVQGILQIPGMINVINLPGFFIRACSMFKEVVPNPEELILKDPVIQQALMAYQAQKSMVQDQAPGQVPAEQPSQVPPGQETGQAIAASAGAAGGL